MATAPTQKAVFLAVFINEDETVGDFAMVDFNGTSAITGSNASDFCRSIDEALRNQWKIYISQICH